MGKITLSWGEWGDHKFKEFCDQFSRSDEFMRTPMEGIYSHMEVIEDMIAGRPAEQRYSEGMWLASALNSFAMQIVPQRVEDHSGTANVYNPLRDTRDGARPSVPELGKDTFKLILEGDEIKGHALITEFDQDAEMDLDDLSATDVATRTLGGADAHAVSIVNKYPAYVRVMDEKLITLLDRIGFTTHRKFADGKFAALRSIPFGMNLVTFPFKYVETLSSMSVYELYAVLLATQRGLRRAIATAQTPSPLYDVFMNIRPLAGGTQPRIHTQAYVRTRIDSLESNELKWDGRLTQKDCVETDVTVLNWGNRSWQAFVPPIRQGKFDLRLELKHERRKEFTDLTEIELWDLAELLVYHSNALDRFIGVPERNIQFYPTGVVIRPFAVDGGHEKIRDERIHGQPPSVFARKYNLTDVPITKEQLYKMPRDRRGSETFARLMDPESLILRHRSPGLPR